MHCLRLTPLHLLSIMCSCVCDTMLQMGVSCVPAGTSDGGDIKISEADSVDTSIQVDPAVGRVGPGHLSDPVSRGKLVWPKKASVLALLLPHVSQSVAVMLSLPRCYHLAHCAEQQPG